jgi:hypothetical protein
VKRRRSSAPGRLRPDGRWTYPILLVALVAVLVTACGQATTTETPPGSPASSADAGPTDTATTDPSTESPTEPSVSAEPTAPDSTPATSPGSSADPSAGTGDAAACTGSDENRDFFASMAAAVAWTVYCPVLSDGWFVEDGHYRLASGGWMEISYDGPGDAGIVLRQGSFCEGSDSCVPAGSEIGDAAFGDRSGRLVAVADGSWAVVVDRGAVPSWLLVVQGLDEASARTIAAELRAVTG